MRPRGGPQPNPSPLPGTRLRPSLSRSLARPKTSGDVRGGSLHVGRACQKVTLPRNLAQVWNVTNRPREPFEPSEPLWDNQLRGLREHALAQTGPAAAPRG